MLIVSMRRWLASVDKVVLPVPKRPIKRKDALFYLAGVFRIEDDHHHVLEVDLSGCDRN
jgi:hypothetical protein